MLVDVFDEKYILTILEPGNKQKNHHFFVILDKTGGNMTTDV